MPYPIADPNESARLDHAAQLLVRLGLPIHPVTEPPAPKSHEMGYYVSSSDRFARSHAERFGVAFRYYGDVSLYGRDKDKLIEDNQVALEQSALGKYLRKYQIYYALRLDNHGMPVLLVSANMYDLLMQREQAAMAEEPPTALTRLPTEDNTVPREDFERLSQDYYRVKSRLEILEPALAKFLGRVTDLLTPRKYDCDYLRKDLLSAAIEARNAHMEASEL